MKKNKYLFMLFMKINCCRTLFICTLSCTFLSLNTNAQNLLDMQNWTMGTGSSGQFTANGQIVENTRFWGEGPQGQRAILWEGKPEGANNDDGGFNHGFFAINHTKMYRFSIWIKKTNSNDGTIHFGTNNTIHLNGVVNNNPYFWAGDFPELNKWYLLVGYVHGSGDTSTINYGAIYDGTTGIKIESTITDFKFAPDATVTNIRSYLYYDPNTNDRQYFYAPRVEVVDGNEPTIASLLSLTTVLPSQGYFSGNVGIKTQTPRDYELAVNGKIRAREVKVETANWPDYVFADDYNIGSLEELERYIKKNKHLPSMPSAKYLEKNGIQLGEMLKLQQQKIEELTLHLIAKDKQILETQKAVEALKVMVVEKLNLQGAKLKLLNEKMKTKQ